MLNCCKQDNSSNSRSSFTFNNFDEDENNKKIDINNVNKEESKEEPVKVENPNNTENIPAPSSG